MNSEHIETQAEFTPLRFHGQAGDYFKIWIVNLLLTLITLGIYSPWAKIRKIKYMNQSTEFKGSRLDYHAEPLPILIGRAIAVVVFGFYFWGGQISWAVGVFGFLLLVLVAPFLFVKSLRFRTKNTSYRNIRFGFRGTIQGAYDIWFRYGSFYFAFILIALLSVAFFGEIPDVKGDKKAAAMLWSHPTFLIQIGAGLINLVYTFIIAPHVLNAIYNFIYNQLYYGESKVSINADSDSVSRLIVMPYFKAVGLFILSLFLFIFSIGFLSYFTHAGVFVLLVPMIFGIYGFVFYISVLFPYLTITYVWCRLGIATYKSRIKLPKSDYMMLVFTNLIGIGLSLGLLIPWAQIRYRKFITEAKAFNIDNLDQFEAAVTSSTSPFADEMVDIFDVDFEIGL